MASQTQVDDAAVREIFSWAGAAGQIIRELVDETEDTARILAPVSLRGSRYSPPGHLKAGTGKSLIEHTDDAGLPLGLIGAPNYPYAFIKGTTRNSRGKGSRRVGKNYLPQAIDTVFATSAVFGDDD